MTVDTGFRGTAEIQGVEHIVGVAEMPDGMFASYMPRNSFRYKPGDTLTVSRRNYRVLTSGMSDKVPRMVLLKVEPAEVSNG